MEPDSHFGSLTNVVSVARPLPASVIQHNRFTTVTTQHPVHRLPTVGPRCDNGRTDIGIPRRQTGLIEVVGSNVVQPDSMRGSGSQRDREAWAIRLTPHRRVSIEILEKIAMSPVFLAPPGQYHAACGSE